MLLLLFCSVMYASAVLRYILLIAYYNFFPMVHQSELYGSEMTSMCLIRDETRLVVGSGEGTLFIFKWGEFGFHIDRFSGHPDHIHCTLAITDRMVLTGCEDGIIRYGG